MEEFRFYKNIDHNIRFSAYMAGMYSVWIHNTYIAAGQCYLLAVGIQQLFTAAAGNVVDLEEIMAMYFSCCLATDAMNVLQPVFSETLGWEYSKLSMPFTVGGYILIAASFFYSTYVMKKGTRLFAVVSFAAMSIGTLLIGIAYSMGSDSYALFFAVTKPSELGMTPDGLPVAADAKTEEAQGGVLTMKDILTGNSDELFLWMAG